MDIEYILHDFLFFIYRIFQVVEQVQRHCIPELLAAEGVL